MPERQNPPESAIKTARRVVEILLKDSINRSPDYDRTVDPADYEVIMKIVGRIRLGQFVADSLNRYLPVTRNGVKSQVLDIAAGTGLISDPLSKKGYKVVAADLSEKALKFLHNKLPHIEAVRLNMNQGLPFDSESFDGITTVFANRYISDSDAFLEEVHRVLKPGGVFLWPVFSLEERGWKEQTGNEGQPTTPNGLLTVVQKAGFSNIEILKPNTLAVTVRRLLHPLQVPTFIVAVK